MNERDEDVAAAGKRRIADQRLGAFVTNKWLVGILVALTMSMGGYIFQSQDKAYDAQAADHTEFRKTLSEQDSEISSIRSTTQAQYNEIIRRLERIERTLDAPVPRARRISEAP